MVVEVAAENEGVRLRQHAAGADRAIGWKLSLGELLKDCTLVPQPALEIVTGASAYIWTKAESTSGGSSIVSGVIGLDPDDGSGTSRKTLP